MKLVTSCISLVIFASAVCFVIAAEQKCISKRAEFKPLVISPSFVPVFGNTPITIQGPPLTDAVKVEIRFRDETPFTVTATISEGKATCLVPFLYSNGRIQVDMIVTRTSKTVDTYYGFIYTEKHRTDIKFEFTSTTQVKVTWDKTKFDAGTSLKLVLLELAGGVFTPRGPMKINIPNNGLFTGDLDATGITLMQTLRNVYIVQLQSSVQVRTTTGVSNSPLVSDFLNLLNRKTQAEIDKMCLDWYVQDSGAPKDAEPCPPTYDKAQKDKRFGPVEYLKPYNPDAEYGFMQSVPSKSGAAQRCVYKGGKLLVGPPSGGNVRKVSPIGFKDEIDHYVADIMPWFLCCNNNKANCNLYYERRPSNDGSDYVEPKCGCVNGDPHFTTFDGFYYTFLGLGEFWIIKSLDSSFSMQGRFTQYLNTGATVCTVYVMQYRGCDGLASIQLSLRKDYIELMIDGQIVAFEPNQPKRTIVHKGASIVINSQKLISVTFSTGFAFTFTYDPSVINIVSVIDSKLKNSFRGLMGNFDGNQDNELTYLTGKVIPKNSNAKDIHDFGMSWKINCEDSLFTYPSDKGFESFHDDKYIPKTDPVEVDKVPPQIKEVCANNYQCLFDYTVTGNREMALSTLATIQTYTTITQTFSVTCPQLLVPKNGNVVVVNLELGSAVKLDCNDKFKLKGNDSVKCVRNARGELGWEGTLGECVQSNPCANDNTWLQWLCENGFNNAKK